ncbi:MAG TPA: Na-translocating system protein MpsC family protein [Solirubrobacteraceae bacterium]|jgi:uncharacterized protein YbcI
MERLERQQRIVVDTILPNLKWARRLPPGPVARSSRTTSDQSRGRINQRQDMTAGDPEPGCQPLGGGKLLAEITNRIVALMREHYGRGPIKAKTYVVDNLIVCVLCTGFTAIERTMMDGGEPDLVLDMRRDFQRMMKRRYSEMIEELTGRKVLAVLSQAHIEPDLSLEVFLMDGPVPGFGALELVDPAAPEETGHDS